MPTIDQRQAHRGEKHVAIGSSSLGLLRSYVDENGLVAKNMLRLGQVLWSGASSPRPSRPLSTLNSPLSARGAARAASRASWARGRASLGLTYGNRLASVMEREHPIRLEVLPEELFELFMGIAVRHSSYHGVP